MAGQAWEEEFSHVQNEANVPRFKHANAIQVLTSDGSIAGQISKWLPEMITMERGLLAMQKATQLTDEVMELLD